MDIVTVHNLKKYFGKGDSLVKALDGIDLAIEKGKFTAIIGASGSGKTTLLNMIGGMDIPDEGEIIVDGVNLRGLKEKELAVFRRSKVGFIYQNFNLVPTLTVKENILFPLSLAGSTPDGVFFDEIMELLHLHDRLNAYPGELSGGGQQRVAIARALASDPEMLLCDEATSALDPMTTQSILSLLQKINRELGITVVLITHEMAVIRQICNKVAILDGGKLAEQGTVDDVFMHTKSAAGRRLFGILPEQEEIPPQPAIRIVFDGEAAEKPIISKLVKDCGLDVNILSADIRQLNQKAYGQMLIARPQDPEDVKRVMEYLALEGLTVEEVHVP